MKEFQSFGAFAAHLGRTAAMGEEVSHFATESAAKIIRDDARSRIGEYQDAVGGFAAWSKLADSTIADRVSKGFTPDDPLLRTGDMRDSITETVHGTKAVIGSDSPIALYQEQGTVHIPPRPFLGPAGYSTKGQVGKRLAETVIAWVCGVGWKAPRIKL